jgi:DNA-binding transcriptional LysR family regulator
VIAIEQAGNLSRAAEVLHVSQPALSYAGRFRAGVGPTNDNVEEMLEQVAEGRAVCIVPGRAWPASTTGPALDPDRRCRAAAGRAGVDATRIASGGRVRRVGRQLVQR